MGAGQPRKPDSAAPHREPVERGDSQGVGQPRQPDSAAPRREPVERGDTPELDNLTALNLGGNQLSGDIPPELGPRKPDNAGSRREPADRVHTQPFARPPVEGQPGRSALLPVRFRCGPNHLRLPLQRLVEGPGDRGPIGRAGLFAGSAMGKQQDSG